MPRAPDDELLEIERAGLRRQLRQVEGPQAAEVTLRGRSVVNFSSNNYLGLADHPALIAAATEAMAREGFGAGASRLIVGNLGVHRELEAKLAAWKGTEAALLFNSGYHANVGALSGLCGREDAIFSDALNHASLIDGARLSRAHVRIYPHLDLVALERQLREAASFRRRLIVTDSVFSMDGDEAPVRELAALARTHDAWLFVDEAHAAGVLGEGAGLAQGLGVELQMGTLGKALGAFGAYVAGSRAFIDLLVHRARSFVFTTALPVPVVAGAIAALELVTGPEGAKRREQLLDRCREFHEGLRALGLPAPQRPSHIVPLVIGDAARTMSLCERLLERGIFAQGIRPPTVPQGTSRLRFALMATHTPDHIARALGALAELRDDLMRA